VTITAQVISPSRQEVWEDASRVLVQDDIQHTSSSHASQPHQQTPTSPGGDDNTAAAKAESPDSNEKMGSVVRASNPLTAKVEDLNLNEATVPAMLISVVPISPLSSGEARSTKRVVPSKYQVSGTGAASQSQSQPRSPALGEGHSHCQNKNSPKKHQFSRSKKHPTHNQLPQPRINDQVLVGVEKPNVLDTSSSSSTSYTYSSSSTVNSSFHSSSYSSRSRVTAHEDGGRLKEVDAKEVDQKLKLLEDLEATKRTQSTNTGTASGSNTVSSGSYTGSGSRSQTCSTPSSFSTFDEQQKSDVVRKQEKKAKLRNLDDVLDKPVDGLSKSFICCETFFFFNLVLLVNYVFVFFFFFIV
jgi:hypothetical protein